MCHGKGVPIHAEFECQTRSGFDDADCIEKVAVGVGGDGEEEHTLDLVAVFFRAR